MKHISRKLVWGLSLLVLAAVVLTYFYMATPDGKKVLVAILARNKAHVLPKFLKGIEDQDYPKKLITVYINTNNNSDETKELLEAWQKKNASRYADIVLESHDVQQLASVTTNPHEWQPLKLRTLALIRNKSLLKAKEHGCDYYFVADCDNFLAPSTLSLLVSKDKPIIAPMLYSIPEQNDVYSNFFYAITDNGYFASHPDFFNVFFRKMIGTYKVPLVHCAYLIKSEYIDKLNYLDGTNEYEFIIFSRNARKNNVDQYICNEIEFGTQLHYHKNLTLAEEKERFNALKDEDFIPKLPVIQ